MLVLANKVLRVSAAGAVEPGLEVAAADAGSLAVFPDGSFAFATSTTASPGCTIYRYGADGTPDQAFAKAGVFSDPSLQQCVVTAPVPKVACSSPARWERRPARAPRDSFA
jgi:hypothetical protein